MAKWRYIKVPIDWELQKGEICPCCGRKRPGGWKCPASHINAQKATSARGAGRKSRYNYIVKIKETGELVGIYPNALTARQAERATHKKCTQEKVLKPIQPETKTAKYRIESPGLQQSDEHI